MITDGDVAGALMTTMPGTGVDVLMGIGGAPEAVDRGLRDEVHGWRDPDPTLAAQRS